MLVLGGGGVSYERVTPINTDCVVPYPLLTCPGFSEFPEVHSHQKQICMTIVIICLLWLYTRVVTYRGTSLMRNTHPPRITIGP